MISYKSETPGRVIDLTSVEWTRVLPSATMARTEYVDRHKAAELLGVTPRQILRYVDKGWLTKYPGSFDPRRVRYCRREIRSLQQRKLVDESFIPVQQAS